MLTTLTQARLLEVLSYEESTGIFRWINSGNGGRKAEEIAGTVVEGGYISIGIDQKYYKAHRLVWLYVHGAWPDPVVDHIDRDPSNNRLVNLRQASHRQNSFNKVGRANRTGFKGVTRCGHRFVARAHPNGKRVHLGYFDTPEAANAAYLTFTKASYGEFCVSDRRVPEFNTERTA